MNRLLTMFCITFCMLCYSQTDSLALYKKGYLTCKELNKEYKIKVESLNGIINQHELQVIDLREIITTKDFIIKNDSLQIDNLLQQQKLLKENLNIYQKEFERRDKFWNKPWFGAVLGVVGTVSIIHVIDYTLPR